MARILQLTDLHLFADASQRLKGIDTTRSLNLVIDHLCQMDIDFDTVVVTGDHTHDELAESYRLGQDQLKRLSKPIYRVPGNHDDRAVMRSVFTDLPGNGDDPVRFVFETNAKSDWLCIGLDSHLPGQVAGLIQPCQMEWLQQRLTESECRHVSLFLHHPPVDIRSEWMDQIGLEGRDLLADVVKSDDRIQLIVCGHVHHDFRSNLHQATVLASPSTGIQFDPSGAEPNFSNDAPGFRILELSPDGWSTDVIRVPEAAGTLDLS